MVQRTSWRPRLSVTCDGCGVVSHSGSRLLADLAEVTGLTGAFSEALVGLRERRSAHDPGRVLTDLAVLLADGGETISDLAVLREQPGLFGAVAAVASTATAWRVLDAIDAGTLQRLRVARAAARERAWLSRTELGRELPAARAGGRTWPGLVLAGAFPGGGEAGQLLRDQVTAFRGALASAGQSLPVVMPGSIASTRPANASSAAVWAWWPCGCRPADAGLAGGAPRRRCRASRAGVARRRQGGDPVAAGVGNLEVEGPGHEVEPGVPWRSVRATARTVGRR